MWIEQLKIIQQNASQPDSYRIFHPIAIEENVSEPN